MDPVSKVPRKRTANYTAEEKSLLIQLMKKRPFLKSKLTDGKSIARKKMEWEIVTREFNRHSHIYKRDTLALKRAWENMSRRSRAPRRNLPRTDIGDSNTAPTPDIGTKVEEVAPVFCDIKDMYDSDGSSHSLSQKPTFVVSQPYCYKEVVKDTPDIHKDGKQQSSTFPLALRSDHTEKENRESSLNSFPQKPLNFVRQEALMPSIESEEKIKMQIWKTQLETAQSNKRRAEYEEETSKIRLEIELESAQCHKRAAENEEEASKIRLEKAKLDLETLKFKLGLKNLGF